MNNKMCINCKYLKDDKYCNRKKSDIFNPKIFCGYWRSKLTVFDRITTSPEELAPKLVYSVIAEDICLGTKTRYYYSTITGQRYTEETKAIDATLEKLKEAQ